jgi:hypothetical protein
MCKELNPIQCELDEFFQGYELSQKIFHSICHFTDNLGQVKYKSGKSQISLRRKKLFAWVWVPGKYLKGKTAPLVLTIAFRYKHSSSRWKEIVEPYPGRFIHHLELFTPPDFDVEVQNWMQEAWNSAA